MATARSLISTITEGREMRGETGQFEEKAKKVFSDERKEDVWVLIISAISVILGLAGVITKKTYPSLFF